MVTVLPAPLRVHITKAFKARIMNRNISNRAAVAACLILATLFSYQAQAREVIGVDPGPVGGQAYDFSFDVEVVGTNSIELEFFDNKTLIAGPGKTSFMFTGLSDSGLPYIGVLLDEFGNEIPGTEFEGITDFDAADIDLAETTVFSSILFKDGAFLLGPHWLLWLSGNPTVGEPPVGDLPPEADANGPYTGVEGVAVEFDGTKSTGDIASYDWTFGDGGTATGATVSHTFSEAGTYNVTLSVTDTNGTVASDNTTSKIGATGEPPTAAAGGPYEGTVGESVAFDGTGSSDPDDDIDSYDWDFGDLSVGTGATTTHTYAAEGEYPVVLTVTDATGESDDDPTTATVARGNQPPSADAGGPVTGVAGVPVTFDGRGSSDPDDGITQYDWDYGDDSSDIDAGPTPSHTYEEAGIYTVTLTVTDGDGASDSSATSADIAEDNLAPVADAAGPYTGDVGVAVEFDSTGSTDEDGNIIQRVWYFGDGQSAVGETPSHVYEEAGDYQVELFVIDDGGGVGKDITSATIGSDNMPPVAQTTGPYAGIVDAPVDFDGTPSYDTDGEVASHTWDFGDGNSGAGAQPQHTYLAQGTYEVTLTVTDDRGASSVTSTKAIIGDGNIPPEADAGGPYRGRVGTAVTFMGSASSDRDGDIQVYEWSFGDGLNGGSETIGHVYNEAGWYHVTLTVTDEDGAQDSDSVVVRIGETSVPPVADAGGPYFTTIDQAVQFNGENSDDPDGDVVSWEWQFGDGQMATGPTPQHIYRAAGTYTVILTVTDTTGEVDIDVTRVLAAQGNRAPTADAGGPYGAVVGAPVEFNPNGSSDPDGDIVAYAWEFGDETRSNAKKPTHTYEETGRYIVTLTVSDDGNLSDSDGTVAVVNVEAAPIRDVLAIADANDNGSPDIAMIRRDVDLLYRAYLFDGASGEAIRTLDLGASIVNAVAVVERSGGPDDIAALRRVSDGSSRVLVVNTGTGETVANLRFGKEYPAIDLAADDVDGDGAPDVGVLGENADGKTRVLFRTVDTEAVVVNRTQGTRYRPLQLLTLPTVNGGTDVETSTSVIDSETDKALARIYDSGSGEFLRALSYGAAYQTVTTAVIPDAGGPGLAGIAQLGVGEDPGSIRVRLRDAATGAAISTGTANANAAVDLGAVDDLNDDGAADIAALILNADDVSRVVLFDAISGDKLKNVDMESIDQPAALAISADIDGNGEKELVGLGERDGVDRIVIVDSVSREELLLIDVP